MSTVKKSLLTKIVKSKAVKIERKNTNNAWGFGGAVKDVYYLPNTENTIHIGHASYRHMPSAAFINLRDESGRIITESENEIFEYINSIF